MGLVRFRIRELADEKRWTLKEVADRAEVPYSTVRHYARSEGLATVDLASIHKIARSLDVLIEDLMEVVKE
ncbi:helix-turn-helix transcriptional regulator [Oscillatoria sp. FACHB-1406]|uniref:helix-turn-helix domain-containing protein n=1 Tax=Oscillatoria sp. FACHB-1406 TaxID=2692846 RepID=UPI001687727F|nr:helix-turn-helix transcriptional regulator [Oscillatoria sp. FACHB-1406]MBD2577156.1 helix-turn-helix transcriptional regulator [Oscillatoria sp. FACHB-1406]